MRTLVAVLLCVASGWAQVPPAAETQPAPTSRSGPSDGLLDKANSANPYISVRATEALAKFGMEAWGAVERFVERRTLYALSPQVVTWLGTLNDPRPRALLIRCLKDSEFPWRPFAVRAMAQPRSANEAVQWMPFLTDALPAVRESVILGLGAFARSPGCIMRKPLIDDLAGRLADEAFEPRLAAAEVLTALDDPRGVAMLLAALGCTRKWFDVDYGELARRRAWTALQYFDIAAPFNPSLPAAQTVDVRQSIHRALEIKTGKAITLPPPFEPDPVNVIYGLEVRSCRRGDAYIRLLADGRLVLGHYDLRTVKLPEPLFASLRKELEALRGTPDSPFFGMGGCDYECHFLPDEPGMRRFMVGLSGRPVGGRRLVELLGSALDATVGESEGDAFRDRSAPFGPDDDGS